MKKEVISLLKYATLPLLASIYPATFHYANNVSILVMASYWRVMVLNLSIALILYIFALVLLKRDSVKASNAVFVFLVFFNTYGLMYQYFWQLDKFRVEHYTLLPVTVFIGLYTSWLVTKFPSNVNQNLWHGLALIVGGVVFLNLVKIVPAELNKKKLAPLESAAPAITGVEDTAGEQYPDIYYIVFDEFASFEAMRNYWHYDDINDFVDFLSSAGFFIAEQSHSGTRDTLQIMSSRLNFKEYPLGGEYQDMYYNDIANNRVMHYLKSKGYTTVVFDETRTSFAYPAKPPVNADHSFEYKTDSFADIGVLFDDYGILVSDNTMLLAFSKHYKLDNPIYQEHKGMIQYTLNNITLSKISSPKFVYVHLMLPHMPFMFDKHGNVIDPKYYKNWDYYLGNYQYAVKIAGELVTAIITHTEQSAGTSPVIILQSDHGARNNFSGGTDGKVLPNFPEEYKTNIMFALYLPAYDASTIPGDVNPINTFPIVFNYLFDANIPLE